MKHPDDTPGAGPRPGRSLARLLARGPLRPGHCEGTRLGPFRLEAELGRGGMGVVFRARHDAGGPAVALKVVAGSVGGESETRSRRFAREARLSAEVDHRAVVRILDAGVADDLLWASFELVEGETLEAAFARGLEPERCVALVLETARGVAAAHARGIVHRDLKPANVLVRASDGQALVADFGVARHWDRASSLTDTGALVGTPAAMAPEQINGEPATAATDVFALGALLYEGLTGWPPYDAPNLAMRHRALAEGALEPPSRAQPACSAALDAVVLRALRVRPEERYADAGALVEALEAAVAAPSTLPGAAPRRALASGWPGLGAGLGAGLGRGLGGGLGVGLGAALVLALTLALAFGLRAAQLADELALAEAKRVTVLAELEARGHALAAAEARAAEGARELAEARERVADRRRRAVSEESDQHLREAMGLLVGEALVPARELYARALAADPSNVEALYGSAAARHRARDMEGALDDLRRALELEPRYADALRLRAAVRCDLTGIGVVTAPTREDLLLAQGDLVRAVELDPLDALAWGYLGIVRARLDDPRGAIDAFGRAARLDGWSSRRAGLAASTYAQLEDRPRAFLEYDRAITLATQPLARWHYQRGWLRYLQGDHQRAIADMEAALHYDPDHADALTARGHARVALDELREGLADYERALELIDPESRTGRALQQSRMRVLRRLGER